MKIFQLSGLLLCAVMAEAGAADPASLQLHGQFTAVGQGHPAFHSPYEGANSLTPDASLRETTDLTLYGGARLWQGGELYVNGEVDQGFGLSNTLGLAGYSSGEAYKVGSHQPYLKLQRAFLRQTVDLGGDDTTVGDGLNQLAGHRDTNHLLISAGKLSVGDLFDTNDYAHDPRRDFLNWSLIDGGAFDYAADAWGYTYGAAAEWTQDRWTLRSGVFALSNVPNSTKLDYHFKQFAWINEIEERHQLAGQDGSLKLLAFVNDGHMARYDDAVRLAQQTGLPADAASVRRTAVRPGWAVNLQQALSETLGGFARLSANDGSKEAFEFTDINRSASAGLSLQGTAWHRQEDRLGAGVVINGLSADARRYFAAGGTGILIGDGQLPHYGTERIAELYYSLQALRQLALSIDYQFVDNPAYNRDRGPVSIAALRLHAEF